MNGHHQTIVISLDVEDKAMVRLDDHRRAHRERMDPMAWGYYASGADGERTLSVPGTPLAGSGKRTGAHRAPSTGTR